MYGREGKGSMCVGLFEECEKKADRENEGVGKKEERRTKRGVELVCVCVWVV